MQYKIKHCTKSTMIMSPECSIRWLLTKTSLIDEKMRKRFHVATSLRVYHFRCIPPDNAVERIYEVSTTMNDTDKQ